MGITGTTTARTRTQRRREDVASTLAPLLSSLLGCDATAELPVRFEFWDGSALGPAGATGKAVVRSPQALRRVLWSPNELGLGRAYVSGDIEVDGDLYGVLAGLRDLAPTSRSGLRPADVATAAQVATRLGVIGPPPTPPPEEARQHGLQRHSKQRDAEAISHHYDVGNDFYRIVLGPAMTYSCARFVSADDDLATAQASKHELICRKLGLHEGTGQRLLDVGCGWGTMAIHAAQHHGAEVVAITISDEQAKLAAQRVAAAGLGDRVEIRVQDYRDLTGERFDAISSIGMFEHVGAARTATYFETLRSLLTPRGRLLNHAISKVEGSKLPRRGFMYRYVFPDGELLDVSDTVAAMQRAGFEMRDVESLREHYALTLRHWVTNLTTQWDRAVELVGEARTRVWQLYMAGSALSFEDNRIAIHQVLGVATDDDGHSGMPATRDAWRTAPEGFDRFATAS